MKKNSKYDENGLLHCDDGPAQQNRNIEEYYIHGKEHREDGPAISNRDYDAWYINGICHRLDGPAKITKMRKVNRRKEYGIFNFVFYQYGISFFTLTPCQINAARISYDSEKRFHSDDPNLPAFKTNTISMWCQHGRFYRPDNKPAIVWGKKEWYFKNDGSGLLHREDDLPAIIDKNKHMSTLVYYIDGFCRRLNEDYSRIETVYGHNHRGETILKLSYENNKLHNLYNPAYIYTTYDKSGNIVSVSERYFIHGNNIANKQDWQRYKINEVIGQLIN